MRKPLARGLNMAVPGAGLILLRREWLGVLAALSFGLCAQIGLWGRWIVPAVIPGWVTAGALFGAGLVWLGAQYILVLQIREAFGPGINREITHLCQAAEQAVTEGAYAKAEELLRVALTLNDEDPRVNILWAQLMTALGRFHHARQAWHRVLQLSRAGPEKHQAVQALATLP